MTDQLSMFEVPETLPFQAHSGTSRAAAEEMRSVAISKRAAVLMVIEQSTHGRTDE
jgi:hypothetical protein